MEYLGLVFDTVSMSWALPAPKVESTTSLCQSILNQDKVKLRDIASVLGKFVWASLAVQSFTQGHFRSLQSLYINSVKRFTDLSRKISLTTDAKLDLLWWVTHLENSNGKGFFPMDPDLIIFTLPCMDRTPSATNLRPDDHGLFPIFFDTSTS